jgi:4-amino-4-deoxy-L-arabinose transferase-like glycosyltransferase
MAEPYTATAPQPGPQPQVLLDQAALRRVPEAHPWPALALALGRPGAAEASRSLLLFLLLLLVALVLRASAFLPSVINPDESLYAVQAQAWLRGGWPYVAVWDMHPVGAPALFAATFALFGESLASLRLLGVVAVAGTGFALYRGVRAAGCDRPTGVAAGLAYVACSALLDGLATNAEILLAPFVAGAMALGLRAMRRALRLGEPPGLRLVLLAGLMVGLALLVKPVVLPLGCLVFLVLVVPAQWVRLMSWRRLADLALAYALACGLPMAGVALVYALRGDWAAFVDGNVLAPLRYLGMGVSLAQAMRLSVAAGAVLLLPALLACGVLLPGRLPGRPLRQAELCLARMALAWLCAAMLAVAMPGMYFPHYFLLLLAPVALLAAMGARRLARLARPGLVLAGFAALLGVTTLQAWSTVLLPRLEHGIGLRVPDPPQRVAAALNAALQPGETIFVVNWQPLLYFLTHTVAPTRYVLPAQLTGRFAGVTGIDPEAELARILATRPRFLVLDSGRWGEVKPAAQAMVTRVLEQDYQQYGQLPGEDGSTVELWRLR